MRCRNRGSAPPRAGTTLSPGAAAGPEGAGRAGAAGPEPVPQPGTAARYRSPVPQPGGHGPGLQPWASTRRAPAGANQ